jgi:hypothetical protein
MSSIRTLLLAFVTVAAVGGLSGCAVYEPAPAPGYYAGGPAYYVAPSAGIYVGGGGGWHREGWRRY